MVIEIEKDTSYEKMMRMRQKYGSQTFQKPAKKTEEERKREIRIQALRDQKAMKEDLERGFRMSRRRIVIEKPEVLLEKEKKKKVQSKKRIEKKKSKTVSKKPVRKVTRKKTISKPKTKMKRERKLNVQYKISGLLFKQTGKIYNDKESANVDAKKLRKENRARIVPWNVGNKTEYYIYMRKGKKN